MESPVLIAGIFGAHIALGNAGIVDQHVHPAVIGDDLCGQRIDIGRLGDIQRQADGLIAQSLQRAGNRFRTVRHQLRDDHLRARLAQRAGAGRTNPLTTAGNHGDATIEF